MVGQILCALTAIALLFIGIRSAQTGRMGTMHGTLHRARSPKAFGLFLVFLLGGGVFLFLVALGVFGPVGR